MEKADFLGIMSILFAFVFAPLGLILGIVGYRRRKKLGQSTTLSLIGSIISGILTFLILLIGVAGLALFGVYERPSIEGERSRLEGCFPQTNLVRCVNMPSILFDESDYSSVITLPLRNINNEAIEITDVRVDHDTCGDEFTFNISLGSGRELTEIPDGYPFFVKIKCPGDVPYFQGRVTLVLNANGLADVDAPIDLGIRS